MAKSGKSGIDRVQQEGSETGLGDMVAAQMIKQSLPGIMSGGKEVVGTEWQEGKLKLFFSDGMIMLIEGNFKVRYLKHATLPGEEEVEGEIVFEEDDVAPRGHDAIGA